MPRWLLSIICLLVHRAEIRNKFWCDRCERYF